MSSTMRSSIICTSENRNVVGLSFTPANIRIFLISSRQSFMLYPLTISTMDNPYPEMNVASFVMEERPDPPTPNSKALPWCMIEGKLDGKEGLQGLQ